MTRRYYNNPPTTSYDVPDFIRRHYNYDIHISSQIRDMIQWSIKEYNQALRTAYRQKAIRFADFLAKEYSAYRVLAESEGFGELLGLINENNYNKLDARERVFVRRAYEFYKALS